MPVAMALLYVAMRGMDFPLPAPKFSPRAALLAFFVGALGEESWVGRDIASIPRRRAGARLRPAFSSALRGPPGTSFLKWRCIGP